METFNKLVRDKIPEMIEDNGENCKYRILDEDEYADQLKIKLKEEVKEYLEATNDGNAVEELADILEVIRSFFESHRQSLQELEEVRQYKLLERGGFKNRYFLISKN